MCPDFGRSRWRRRIERNQVELQQLWLERCRRRLGPEIATDEYLSLSSRFFSFLIEALLGSGERRLSSFEWREPTKAAVLLAAHLANRNRSVSWLLLSLGELAEVLHEAHAMPTDLPTLLFGLAASATEAHHRILQDNERDRLQALFRQHTPLVRLPGDLPALFVVGGPDRQTWQELLDRFLTELVRTGSSAGILDVTHGALSDLHWEELDAWARSKHAQKRRIYLCGLPEDAPSPSAPNLLVASSLSDAVSVATSGSPPPAEAS